MQKGVFQHSMFPQEPPNTCPLGANPSYQQLKSAAPHLQLPCFVSPALPPSLQDVDTRTRQPLAVGIRSLQGLLTSLLGPQGASRYRTAFREQYVDNGEGELQFLEAFS